MSEWKMLTRAISLTRPREVDKQRGLPLEQEQGGGQVQKKEIKEMNMKLLNVFTVGNQR